MKKEKILRVQVLEIMMDLHDEHSLYGCAEIVTEGALGSTGGTVYGLLVFDFRCPAL